jgi:hypothetical protein
VEKAKESCGLNPYVLSYAAKVYYILNKAGQPIDEGTAAREGKKLRWEMTEENAKSGIKLLTDLGFVEELAS